MLIPCVKFSLLLRQPSLSCLWTHKATRAKTQAGLIYSNVEFFLSLIKHPKPHLMLSFANQPSGVLPKKIQPFPDLIKRIKHCRKTLKSNHTKAGVSSVDSQRLTSSQWSGGHRSWHCFFPFTQRHDWQPSSHSAPAWLTRTHTEHKDLYSLTRLDTYITIEVRRSSGSDQ